MPDATEATDTDKTKRPATEREVRVFVQKHLGRRAELSVGGEAGLVARVAKDGTLTYAVRYYSRGGKQRTLTIGNVSLGAARKRAGELRARARVSVDPWEEKLAERKAEEEKRRATGRTLTRAAEAWFASREAAEWRAGTRRETERLVRKHFLAEFGDRDANTLARAEIRKFLDKLAESAPSEARHAFVALRGLYNWLGKERQEHLGVTTQPLAGMEKPGRAVRRSRTYSDDEMRRIFAAVCGTSLEDQVGLLWHTGTRDRETRAMLWADVDLDRAIWTIPAEQSKNGRPHTVVLSTGALAILRRRPRFGKLVFANPDTRTGYVERSSKDLRRASIASGLLLNVGTKEEPRYEGEGLRLHDIRRTVGDRLKQEHGEAMMHAVLGHADAALTQIYGPSPRLKAIGEAMEWWSIEVARILAVKAEEKSA